MGGDLLGQDTIIESGVCSICDECSKILVRGSAETQKEISVTVCVAILAVLTSLTVADMRS